MSIALRKFVQHDWETTSEYAAVDAIADKLHGDLRREEVLAQIKLANAPGNSSEKIQQTFLAHAASLGFRSEAKGLFSDYPTSALRPDYFLQLPGGPGILLEVERGKTTINNMDLLDFWKCHLCQRANYLFLLVPLELRQNDTMTPRREFQSVSKRLAAFFVPRNYTNVRGLFLFGY
jgi:hypothetical protein